MQSNDLFAEWTTRGTWIGTSNSTTQIKATCCYCDSKTRTIIYNHRISCTFVQKLESDISKQCFYIIFKI